ncbi:MAG: translocation/assembly module TamB domain-containing protein [Nitrosospira sp.]|nr:translocation/assembly module TamB domain-containing protein [Nitrosospira sp.]
MKKWRWPALFLAALMLVVAGTGLWLSNSTSGLRWLGSAVSALSSGTIEPEGLQGTLSGPIRASSFRFASGDMLLVARDVHLRWQPGSLLSGRLDVIELTAGDVEIVSPSSDEESPPDNLELPLPLLVRRLEIGVLRVLQEEGAKPRFAATDLAAKIESDGRTHRLADLGVSLEFGRLTADGRIEGIRPFVLSADTELTGLAISDDPGAPRARVSAVFSGILEQVDVRVEGSGAGLTGNGEARLRPYAPLKIAELRIAANGLDPHVFSPRAPQANLALQADLRENGAGQLEGSLVGHNRAPQPVDQGGLPLLEVRAHPVLSAELIRLDDLRLVMAGGGMITGNVTWSQELETASADLQVTRIDPVRVDTRLRPASIDGTIKLSGDAKNQEGILALKDRKWHMDAVFERAGDILTLDKLHLKHGRSALRGEGKLGLSGQRPFSFNGALHHFDVSMFANAPRTDLNANLRLAGKLEQVPAGAPAGTVQFTMTDSQIAEQPVTGNGRVEFAGLDLALGWVSGEIELRLGTNRLIARGGFGRKDDKLQLDLAAPALGQLGYEFGGSLTARAVLETGVVRFEPGNLPLPNLPNISFNVYGKNLTFPGDYYMAAITAEGALRGDAIALEIALSDAGTKAEPILHSLQLAVGGHIPRHDIRASARLQGDQGLSLKASGGLKTTAQGWQDTRWLGEVSELAASGRVAFHLTRPASLEAGSQYLSLGTTRLATAGGNVQISEIEWTPQRWSSKGNFSRIGLRAGGDARGEWENSEALRLGGAWDIASTAQLRGTLSIARESGDWILPGDPPFSLGLGKVEFMGRAADGRIMGELKAQGKRLGMASGSMALPLVKAPNTALGWAVPPTAPLSGDISVDMEDISWAGAAFDNSNNLRTGGRLALQADLVGTFGSPRLRGQIRGNELALSMLDQGVRLEHGTLAARFDQESLHLDALDFVAPHQPVPADPLVKHLKLEKGPGRLRASGVMDFTGERGSLEISATLVPLAQRPDRWIIASGSGQASLENNMLTLLGALVADAGLLAQPTAGRPHLPEDVIVIGSEKVDQQEAPRRGLLIDMEADLDLGKRFYIRASGLEGRLDGQLQLRGEPRQPLRAIGTITAKDTKFEAYGQNLTVERGIVTFRGPIDDPDLNVLAVRKGLAVQAGVEVTGSVRQPKVRLVSTPDVPDLEKLSWITLGRAPGGRTDASLLLAAAGSILGGQSGGVTEKISRALGVDELTIRQSGVDALTGQVGVVGKRLSERAYISYEQGLMATAAGVTRLTYNLTPKLTVVTRAGMDNAIDLLYTLRFD